MTTLTRVLIVNDDKDFAQLLQYNLRLFSTRYRIDVAASTHDGLCAIREGEHDIYLLDCEFNNGRSVAALIDAATSRMRPLILLKGTSDDHLGDGPIGAGACDLLIKRHITGHLLDRVIRNSLGRHSRLRRILLRQQEMTNFSDHDRLTGLLNHDTLATKIIEKLRARPQCGALLHIDLDRFQAVNDQYSHDIGDQLLQTVAARLVDCVRPNDIVGRHRGDEFLVYLSVDSRLEQLPEIAEIVAQKLLQTITEPYLLHSPDHQTRAAVSLSASIGIAMAPLDGTDYEQLARLADQAMYQAKGLEKCNVAFHHASLERLSANA